MLLCSSSLAPSVRRTFLHRRFPRREWARCLPSTFRRSKSSPRIRLCTRSSVAHAAQAECPRSCTLADTIATVSSTSREPAERQPRSFPVLFPLSRHTPGKQRAPESPSILAPEFRRSPSARSLKAGTRRGPLRKYARKPLVLQFQMSGEATLRLPSATDFPALRSQIRTVAIRSVLRRSTRHRRTRKPASSHLYSKQLASPPQCS